jgi:hypothetical protein
MGQIFVTLGSPFYRDEQIVVLEARRREEDGLKVYRHGLGAGRSKHPI